MRRDQVRGLEAFARRDELFGSAPADLTLTATGAEGAAEVAARSDHTHGVDALPWGIVARHTLTADSAALSDNGTANWLLDEVSVDASRLYVIHLHSVVQLSVAAWWTVDVRADASLLAVLDNRITSDTFYTVHARVLWEPSTGTPDLDIQVQDVLAAGGTLTFIGSATSPRSLWVEDIGPR